MDLKKKIRNIPDFPKEGIMYRDITTLLSDPEAFKHAVDRFAEHFKDKKPDVSVDLDGSGRADFDTGLPFLEHMLDQIARHGMMDLSITAKGDLHIDAHHTVEDVGITLGLAFAEALGDGRGILAERILRRDLVLPTGLCQLRQWRVWAR